MDKLDKKNIEDVIGLAPMQAGMLFHYLKDPQSERYFEQLSLEISGEIDPAVFEKSWNSVVESNEMLRAVFRWEEQDQPIQIILKTYKIQPRYYDFSDRYADKSEQKKCLDEIKAEERREKFDLRNVPFRVILCKIEKDKHEMIISNHHILYDGWSNGIILREFFAAYNDLSGGKEPLKPVKPKFKEFVKWIKTQNLNTAKQENYWRSYLEGFDTKTELSAVGKRKGKEIAGVGNHRIYFTGERKAEFESFARRHKITLAAFFYTVWGILLQTYDNKDDVVFGTTVSGRNVKVKGIENTVGLFINTIPLRVISRSGETIAGLLARMDKELQQRNEFESTSLVDIKEWGEIDRTEELFDSLVVIENYPLDSRLMQLQGSLPVMAYSMFEMTHYALNVAITLFDHIEVKFIYEKEVFDAETIERLSGHFGNMLDNLIKAPGKAVSTVEAIFEEEKRQLLLDFNSDAQVEYPEGQTIHGLFEERAAQTPDNIALVGMEPNSRGMDRVALTYRELNDRAEQLACLLRKKGVGPDIIVGLAVERSNRMIIAIMGILKAGGAYLPIEPEYPAERIDYMLKDSGAKILLTNLPEGHRFNCQLSIVNYQLSMNFSEVDFHHSSNQLIDHHSGSLVYIIYTSGTTGKPKGILTTHRNVLRVVRDTNYIGLTVSDRILQLSNYAFDGSVFDIYAALVNGGALVLIRKEDVLNLDKLAEIIRKESITLFFITTALFNALVDHARALPALRRIKKILFGGESVSVDHTRRALDFLGKDKIIHVYGPTETTVYASYYYVNRIEAGQANIPIGSPLTGTALYVLDRHMRPTPVGVAGELYIGGSGTARGYLNKQELTAEKFIEYRPYRSYRTYISDKRIYRTGDLVSRLPEGDIEFLGRLDRQVKIRGFRIELGEIENQLLRHPGIREAVVVAKGETDGDKYLCAYVVLGRGGSFEFEDTASMTKELSRYLSQSLSHYMIPSYFVQVDRIPLTANNKVDRKKLPEPEKGVSGKGYLAPANRNEEKLVEIWSEVLKIDKEVIGVDANFFDLGGHSLKATLLISKIHKDLKVKVPLTEVFTHPTIRELSGYIKDAIKDEYIAVEPVEEKEYYQLSSAQKRMYILQQMALESTAYNMSAVIPLTEEPVLERLEETFIKLIRRHESFRTSFHIVADEPVQRIHDEVEFKIKYHLATEATENTEKGVEIQNSFIRPFDLSRAPLLRVALVKERGSKYLLLVDMHHIVADAVSAGVMKKDFEALYRDESLTPLSIRYKDFSQWQNSPGIQETLKEQEVYWLKLFPGEIPVLNLPLDYPRPVIWNFEGHTLEYALTGRETRILTGSAREANITLYMCVLSVFVVLLSRLSGQEEIIIGTPTAGRRHADIERIVGLFVNTLAIKSYPSKEKRFGDFLSDVKETMLEAFENQEYPFEDLVEKVAVNRDPGRNPIFDVMFDLHTLDPEQGVDPRQAKAIENIPVSKKYYGDESSGDSKFDLSLDVMEGECLGLAFEYCTKLFKRETIERFFKCFKGVIFSLEKDPGIFISEIEIIPEEEKKKILIDFNNTDTDAPYSSAGTIHRLFEDQVEKTPARTAVVYDESQLTYNELNTKSNRLARRLRQQGVKPETPVAIMIERSVEMIVCVMAVLKAGGAYLPIDPAYPAKRIDYILENSGVKFLLTGNDFNYRREMVFPGEIIDIHAHGSEANNRSNPEPVSKPWNLAYVIYTSGSTGRPKGVMVQNDHYLNAAFAWRNAYRLAAMEVNLLQMASFSFDVFAGDVARALLNGGKLVICPEEVRLDLDLLYRLIVNQKISLFEATPSLVIPLMDYMYEYRLDPGCLALLILGSDTCPFEDFKKLISRFGKRMRIINSYGVTEATIDTSFYELSAHDEPLTSLTRSVPIGKPLSNMSMYILDSSGKLQPIGVPGELYIGGKGVARGYLNSPEISSERFLPDPFFMGERVYKTGDKARWLPDGNVEFLGRLDLQVKIRGYRIELGEIENLLLNYPGIKETVTSANEDKNGQSYLCTYMVGDPKAERSLEIQEVKDYLSGLLPEYMIPSYFMQVEKIPLTPNGKVDYKGLPAPVLTVGDEYIAPGSEIEEKLAALWSEILGIEKKGISINSNFFQLGGHSLKATIMISKMQKEFDVKVPLSEIFKNPTIRRLAEFIKGAAKHKVFSIKKVEEKEYYPLSSAQKRFFVLEQMDEQGTSYNIPGVLNMEGDVDRDRLKDTFHQIIKRHENLRTSFYLLEKEPVQRIYDEVEFEIEYLAAKAFTMRYKAKEREDIVGNFIRPFDLSKAPLMRVGLIQTGERHRILILDMHHIISDEFSTEIFINDFRDIYSGESPPPLRLQYKDFSEWQNSTREKKLFKGQEAYWLGEFSGEIPVLNLPCDFARPAIKSFAGKTFTFEIGPEETEELKKLALAESSTLFMILLALYNIFLMKISGQDEIVVGTPVAGRNHHDLEQIIGILINTMALRNYPDGKKAINEFLREVTDKTLRAQENQDYPFEDLVEKAAININRDTSRNPLFDVMFTVQNMHIEEINIPGLKLTPYEYESRIAKFDLTLICEENQLERTLHFMVEYSTSLFEEETIARFGGYFKNIVSFVLNTPGRKLEEIEIISEAEKEQILYGFNDTGRENPSDKSIHEWFEQQVEKSPDKIALVGIRQGAAPPANERESIGETGEMGETVHLTYKELDNKANQLACLLRVKGVRSDTIVGIRVGRSIEMLYGILGILKAGGAYLPIELEYPEERVSYMLADSTAKVLLTLSAARVTVGNVGARGKSIEIIDILKGISSSTSPPTFTCKVSPADLAYVIYTSGTSGKPKGTLTVHSNVLRVVKNTNYLDLTPGDRILQLSNYAFDGSVFDIYGALLNGAVLVMIKKEAVLSVDQLSQTLTREAITVFFVTTALFNTLVDMSPECLSRIKNVLFGGERVSVGHVRKALAYLGKDRIIHVYGPTETTVYAAYYHISRIDESRGTIPIGYPLTSTTAYILDKHGKLLPIGVAGELYIGGDGVCRGYLNNPELTAEKFIEYGSYRTYRTYISSRKIYKTGDLTRWLKDGSIEFIGRIDHQVKIRGFRIELGEIEHQLLQHDKINEAIVLARDEKGSGDRYLCAYVASAEEINVSKLKDFLSVKLPGYMIPANFVHVEKLPLTANGKVDRRMLPVPNLEMGDGSTVFPPGNEIEEILLEIWSKVLAVDKKKLGIDADFFQVGGHSLKASILIADIHKAFNIKIPLVEIFRTPTIRELARYLEQAGENKANQQQYVPIKAVEEKEYYELSSAQKRLYILHQMGKSNIHYNLPEVLVLEGKIKTERLAAVFNRLIERYEVFRTSFLAVNDEPVQKIWAKVEFGIEYHDLVREGGMTEERIIENFIQPFDLLKAPLLRVGLIGLEEEKHLLMVDMHHIISDGVSRQIFVEDFCALYAGKELPALRLQYKDYSEWQNNEAQKERVKAQEQFWLKQLTGELPVLNLPLDYKRPSQPDFKGCLANFAISPDETEALRDMARVEGVTLYILFLTIFYVFLYKLTGQETIIVGTDVAGRGHADLKNIFGMVTNTVVLLNYPSGHKTFRSFLHEIKSRTLAALENQEYQFDDLVEKLELKRDGSRNPIFDVIFSFLEFGKSAAGISELHTADLKLKPYELKSDTSPFDLNFIAVENEEQLLLSFLYCTGLFKEDTIGRFINYFKHIISDIIMLPEKKLSELQLMSSKDKSRLLEEIRRKKGTYLIPSPYNDSSQNARMEAGFDL